MTLIRIQKNMLLELLSFILVLALLCYAYLHNTFKQRALYWKSKGVTQYEDVQASSQGIQNVPQFREYHSILTFFLSSPWPHSP